MSPVGQSRQLSGSCHFWELVSRGRDVYKASPDHERDAMAERYVSQWLAGGGRFLRFLRLDETRTAFYVVGNMYYACAMVKYFMSRNWILAPRDHDFLFGKGGQTNTHTGNKRFRGILQQGKNRYNALPDSEKQPFARRCVKNWRDEGGRFLRQDSIIGLWHQADPTDVYGAVQTYMSRNWKREQATSAPTLPSERDPSVTGSSSSFAQASFPAFTSSCQCAGRLLSFDTAPSSDSAEKTGSDATSPPSLPTRKKQGRIAALARWTMRVLEPVRRLFRRGRNSSPLAP
jgi:hypothetical protein